MVPSMSNNISITSGTLVGSVWSSSSVYTNTISKEDNIEPKDIKPKEHDINKKEEKINNKFFSNVVDLIGDKDERTNKNNIKRKSK